MVQLWNTLVYEPLYNTLIFLVSVLPGHSVGLAIITLTVVVKALLYPLTGKAIRAQRAMKELEPELKRIREEYKNDREQQSRKMMELYRVRGVSPFSGCLPVLIQIPIILGLYWVFFKGLPVVSDGILYSFVPAPLQLDMHFLVFDLGAKSVFWALVAGVTQYIQTSLSLGKQVPATPPKNGQKPSFQEDFARSMQMQMRYILPPMIAIIAYSTSAAVALYWATSNILSIAQELHVRRGKNAVKST